MPRGAPLSPAAAKLAALVHAEAGRLGVCRPHAADGGGGSGAGGFGSSSSRP
jgi:hypothetical protein